MVVSGAEDHYALLGVDPSADAAAIRRAWRLLALRWHPDRAGPEAAPTFRKILGAYAVLSDPDARAAYDRRRGSTAVRAAPGVAIRRVSGSLDRLLAAGTARRAEEGIIDLFLDVEEIATGGMVMISMYVPVRCAACRADLTKPCTRCRGQRSVDELFSAWLAVRPGVAEGTVLKPSALLPDMLQPVCFRVRRSRPKVAGAG